MPILSCEPADESPFLPAACYNDDTIRVWPPAATPGGGGEFYFSISVLSTNITRCADAIKIKSLTTEHHDTLSQVFETNVIFFRSVKNSFSAIYSFGKIIQ